MRKEGCSLVAKLVIREGDSIERALKQFKRLCEKEGLRRDIKRASYYEKPSERRRRKKLQQLRERRKQVVKAARVLQKKRRRRT